jgi:hypothetical protein
VQTGDFSQPCQRARIRKSTDLISPVLKRDYSTSLQYKSGEIDLSIEVNGVIGLLILIADIWAIIHIIQSPSSIGAKVLWTALVLLLPVLGLIIWFFAGPRGAAAG